ncbi:MAG: hypothetical protein AB7F74_21260 [Parvibaculaceae bacterium]
MIDDAGAAPAAAEPIAPSQDGGGAAVRPGVQAGEIEAAADRSKETARASIDRAFAEIDAATGQERDDHGRFKAGASQLPSPEMLEQQKAGEAAADKAASALGEPPARFSADAKAAWATVPDSVRGEVHRAFREMESGLSQYQQFFEPLKPFHQLAESHDTTVQDTLGRYVSLDLQLVSDDPGKRLSAIQEVLEYAGISPQEYAALITGQKPDETQAQSTGEIRQLKGQLAEMRQLLGGVSATLRQSRESQLESQVDSMVEEFAKTQPRLNEAEFTTVVTRQIATQMADNLEGAYDMA